MSGPRLGALAALHHEQLDGSGYYRGLPGNMLSPAARILAAADVYHAMTEPRPHCPALAPEIAAEQLQREVHAGRLDDEAVRSVLGAAGHIVRTSTPSRFLCKEGQSRNKQREKAGALSQEALAEQKEAAEICKSHQGKSHLRGPCYTGTSAKHISLQTTHLGWLLVCQQPSVFSCYETGILGKWISCITAQTMVRQLVSVVNASI